jgi:hypothetical protein
MEEKRFGSTKRGCYRPTSSGEGTFEENDGHRGANRAYGNAGFAQKASLARHGESSAQRQVLSLIFQRFEESQSPDASYAFADSFGRRDGCSCSSRYGPFTPAKQSLRSPKQLQH